MAKCRLQTLRAEGHPRPRFSANLCDNAAANPSQGQRLHWVIIPPLFIHISCWCHFLLLPLTIDLSFYRPLLPCFFIFFTPPRRARCPRRHPPLYLSGIAPYRKIIVGFQCKAPIYLKGTFPCCALISSFAISPCALVITLRRVAFWLFPPPLAHALFLCAASRSEFDGGALNHSGDLAVAIMRGTSSAVWIS